MECIYDLRGYETPACPECGRHFDIDDPQSYYAKVPASRAMQMLFRISANFTGITFAAVVFPLLYELQLMWIDLWFNTCNAWINSCRGGSYWYPVGIGRLVYPLQIVLLLADTSLAGWLIRRKIRRKYLHPHSD